MIWIRHQHRHSLQITLVYLLIMAMLLMTVCLPAKVQGAGAAFSGFQVTTESASLYSGYNDGMGGYTKETPTYHFTMTVQDALPAGETIRIELPYGYNYVGNTHWLGLWTPGASVPLGQIQATVDGNASSLFDSVTTEWGEEGDPMLAFHMVQAVSAGANVDIRLAGFLITPDYHYRTAGPEDYAISTAANPASLTARSNIYFRNVGNFLPDSDSYAASAGTAYQFRFTVMQALSPADTITITFPAQMSLPGTIAPATVDIAGIPAASVTVAGSKLILHPSQPLPSYTNVLITVDSAAFIANPAVPGYYTFELSTSVDPLPATGQIGIIAAGGAALADNPSGDEGYINVESDGTLRFRFTSPTILKAGDTVTIQSPAGTLLSQPSITAADIVIEPGMGEELITYTPASITRTADNQLQFVLPQPYYLAPDYGLTFRIPNPFDQQYGQYDMQVSTSQTVKPSTVPLLIAPETVQQFTVTPGSWIAGDANVPYRFNFKPNLPISADDDETITLLLPAGLTFPLDNDPSNWTVSLNPEWFHVNGVAAKAVTYIRFTHSLSIAVPQNIPLLGQVDLTVSGDAGWTNPTAGTATFSVYPYYYNGSKAEAEFTYSTPTGLSASPQAVHLKLGAAASRQLEVTAQLADQSVKDVTSAVYGTIYQSSDTSVAVVTQDGLIVAKSPGEAVVTAALGSYSAAVNVTVQPADVPLPEVTTTGLRVTPSAVTLQLGAAVSQQLSVTAELSDRSVKDVTSAVYGTAYRSSNVSVATVTPEGRIEAKQAGAAVITVTHSVYESTVNVTINPAAGSKRHSGGSTSSTVASGTSADSSSTGVASAEKPLSVEKKLTASIGGTVELPATASVIVPPGALPADGIVKIAVQPQGELTSSAGPVVAFSSSTGTELHRPVTVSLSYRPEAVGAGRKPAVYVLKQGKWQYVGGVAASSATVGTVNADVYEWGTYAVIPAKPMEFTDMKGHWAAAYVDRLTGRDIIKGYEDGSFRPDQPVTRAQLVKLIADALALPSGSESLSFADQAAVPLWAQEAVAQAVHAGMIEGYEEHGARMFKPDRPVTRAELAVILNRALERDSTAESKATAVFTDQSDIPDWALQAVQTMYSQSIVSGYPDGSFRPGGNVTRAEAAKMIYMLLELLHK